MNAPIVAGTENAPEAIAPRAAASAERSSYRLGGYLFLRALALTYAVAFASLGPQIVGLVGSRGILPASAFLNQLSGSGALAKLLTVPTVYWLDPTDAGLRRICVAGVALAVLAFFDIVPSLVFTLLWVLYLSVVFIGQDFLSFQWDNLLLEVGFLAIFLAPWRLIPARGAMDNPPTLVLWMLRIVLFKVMFLSGLLKWLSGDPTWHNLTAMSFHYETQPLPTPIGWLAYQLPGSYHRLETLGVLVLEGLVPFGLFGPRRLRRAAAATIAGLMLLVALTGNYGFFNLLTAALCLVAIDDAAWPVWLRRWLADHAPPPDGFGAASAEEPVPANDWTGRWKRAATRPARGWPWPVPLLLAAWVLPASFFPVAEQFGFPVPRAMQAAVSAAHYWRISNWYGLFTVMTTRRQEVVVEGSNDGEHWQTYRFRFKPGELNQAPGFVAPHMPRLDWQMWFLPLGGHQPGDWFDRFLDRLREGEPSVTGLLAASPFPDHPPAYVRAEVYDYRFTDIATLVRTGDWWRRTWVGEFGVGRQ